MTETQLDRILDVLDNQLVGRSMVLDDDYITCPGCGKTVFVDRKLEHAYKCTALQKHTAERVR